MDLLFQQAVEQKLFSGLDWYVSQFLADRSKLTGKEKDRLKFLICYLSAETRVGHVCVSLQQIASGHFSSGYKKTLIRAFWQRLEKFQYNDWFELLVASGLVSQGKTNTPLILQNGLLYFQRMWLNEQKVVDFFRRSAVTVIEVPANTTSILDILFDKKEDFPDVNWQKIAVALALTRQVAIISGGPGTGKTTTVAKLLAVLLMVKVNDVAPLRIMAAAPTGKAAARLSESLNHAFSQLLLENKTGFLLPNEAVTLHRLLGAKNQQQFAYHKDNPLHLDMLIIDEASMVDLSMMAAVIDALPAKARLILLGDREQLSSVEAGAVLGDLCCFADGYYSKERANELSNLTGYTIPTHEYVVPIADNICLLQKSYRFHKHSGIGLLANHIRQGQSQDAAALLCSTDYRDIEFYVFDDSLYQTIVNMAVKGYSNYLHAINSNDPLTALATFEQFRLLAALREGKYGVNGLNKAIEDILAKRKLIIRSHNDDWYVGRPVMILKNYPALKLYNGDIGITLLSEDDSQRKRVYFKLADGTLRGFSPHFLPDHETAFFMTVHKSQGSEFDHVALILPDEYTPLLTRSLLYTAVTRAKQKMTIYGNLTILSKTIDSQIERRSGLNYTLVRKNSS